MDTVANRRELPCKGGSRAIFTAVCMLCFLASAAVAIERCAPMAAMGAMPMPGGWTLSMAWMRMCGQNWPDAAMSFLGMWMAMTVAMMTPVLASSLWRLRHAIDEASAVRRGGCLALAAAAYFLVWGVLGLAVYPVGAACAALALELRTVASLVPYAAAVTLAGAGMLQLSGWKRRRLAECRHRCVAAPSATPARHAWRQGLDLGLYCTACCVPQTLALLVLGVMDLRNMAVATAAIAAERLAPGGLRIARANGVFMLATGWGLAWNAMGS